VVHETRRSAFYKGDEILRGICNVGALDRICLICSIGWIRVAGS
jgi:hypothetical protein